MATFPVHELTVYEADDVTPLFTVSTSPGHAQPYLKAPDSYPEQEVDFAKGSASIGQCSVQIVDVPTDPTDQGTGYLTGLLADANGYSQVNGHRAVLTENRGSGAETLLDGVVSSVVLLDTFVTYALELRDIRERERKTKAFETTDTPTILPRGVLDGYGKAVPILGQTARFPIDVTLPLTGSYRSLGSGFGEVELDLADRSRLDLTEPMREALESVAPLDGEPETLVYDRWKLLWRDKAAGGAYTTLAQVAHRHTGLPGGGGQLPYTTVTVTAAAPDGVVAGVRINNLVAGGTLPSNGQEIEIIVQYDGPTTSDWPRHLQDLTVGELLRNGYRGDYSTEDPRIRYDESALLALTTPVRAIIEAPVEDFRDWAEKHAYPVAHAAPTLNVAGEISPITYLLPDASVSLATLDDSNCRPAGAGWSHGTEDAVNLIALDYQRDFGRSPFLGTGRTGQDIRTVTQPVRVRNQASIDLLGEHPLEISSLLLRSIGDSDGGPLTGDILDETGAQVGVRVGKSLLDRFSLGGQYFALEVSRDDAGAEALRRGSWATVGVSWMPDYLSGERGASRLAQVVRRRNLDAAWALLILVDAGSAAAPLGVPTLGTITVDAAGVVSIPVTALASGDPDARLDYAVNATEPTANSELWTFLGRADAIETLTTPPLPPGTTAWVRARSEAVGRRPSAYTTAVSIAVPATPRVLSVSIDIDEAGVPTVRWSPNQYCAGVRVYYEVHALATVPSFPDDVDADATDGELELAVIVPDTRYITVRVEPYPTWTGSAVSGTPGPVVEKRRSGSLEPRLRGAYLTAIPTVVSAVPGFLIDLHYQIEPGVDELGIQYDYLNDVPEPGGPVTYDSLFGGGLAVTEDGRERIQNVGDFFFRSDYSDFTCTVTPRSGDVEGTPVVVSLEDPTETGSGTKMALSAGGQVVADYAVPGSNVTIDTDANGRPRINAAGGGGVATLADVGDVAAYSSLGSGEILVWNGSAWVHQTLAEAGIAAAVHTHSAADITSGILATNRGGTGRDTFNGEGRVLVSTDASTLTTVAASTAGGFLRSNGTTWVRATIQASDIPVGHVTQHQASLALAASQITSGTLAVARGGTGVSSPTSGNLLVGAGASAMTLLAPGAAGGYVRSNGSAWVRSTIGAADIVAGTLSGDFTVNLAAGAVGAPSLRRNGDTDTGLWFPAANTLAFSAGGAERFRITHVDATHGQIRFQNGQVHTVEGAEITRGTAGSVALDWDAYNSVDLRNDGNIDEIDIDDASMVDGNPYTLVIRYATGGQASVTWTSGGTLQWQNGSAPTLPQATLGDRTLVTFWKSGGITLGFYADAPA